ncbi:MULTISPECIES: holo-ACP synthase [Candidatus Ichthyocystis]|nr:MULTISPECIES: holo-ACP synthase [Ichthyocystis]
MMIVGVGTDFIPVERFHRLWLRYSDRFCRKILNDKDYPWVDESSPHRGIAKSFAAKEALSKALGVGRRYPLTWSNIAVLRDSYGKPFFAFDDLLLTHLSVYRIHLSLSDDDGHVLAFVIVEL